MNAMCKVIIKKVLPRIFGLWFHEITHICNIYFLNPASLANQEMLISTMFLVWYGSKTFFKVAQIKFVPLQAFFPIRICRKTLILGPWWFAKSNGAIPFRLLMAVKFLTIQLIKQKKMSFEFCHSTVFCVFLDSRW